MLGRILDAVVVLSPLAIAIMSVIVGVRLAKNPQDQTHKRWWWGIISLGIVCSCVTLWQQERGRQAHSDEVRHQNEAIDGLKQDLHKAETGRQVDAAYLKAKLEDANQANSQYSAAIMKLAQVSEENIRKQYETKVLTNKQLRDFVTATVSKMREIERKHQLESQQNFVKFTSLIRQTKDEAQRQKLSYDEMQQFALEHNNYEHAFRDSGTLGDALYARDELLRRLGEQPGTSGRSSLAFQGILAGPTPVEDAADYLEQLIRKLSP